MRCGHIGHTFDAQTVILAKCVVMAPMIKAEAEHLHQRLLPSTSGRRSDPFVMDKTKVTAADKPQKSTEPADTSPDASGAGPRGGATDTGNHLRGSDIGRRVADADAVEEPGHCAT